MARYRATLVMEWDDDRGYDDVLDDAMDGNPLTYMNGVYTRQEVDMNYAVTRLEDEN